MIINRPFLSYFIPGRRKEYFERLNNVDQERDRVNEECLSTFESFSFFVDRMQAIAQKINNLKRYTIIHIISEGKPTTYYVDDYDIEDGAVVFEYDGRIYKLLGNVTITQRKVNEG